MRRWATVAGVASVQRAVVTRERHGHHQRQIRGDRPGRQDRLFDLGEVGLRLDGEQVRTGLGQRRRLFRIGVERLLRLDPAERREAHAERAHRPGDHGAGLERDAHTPDVEIRHPIGQPEPGQAEPVRLRTCS